jgi:putative spermidine/putrescine transport system ATP-binding protein
MTAQLEVRDLVCRYSQDVAVGPISFSVQDGEFFSLLGPSGCGKTTTLRCIAGLEEVTSGEIVLGGRNIELIAPYRRNVGLVFQSPALFPHLTVAKNVAFGLELRKVPRADIRRRVTAALALVELSTYADRMPNQLSGGQQQRVALARALVMEPPLLLLDEPLSSLDLKLRMQMREELHALQRRLRMTSVFVTHDQTEALALSDRIAVLSHGRIEQIGTPQEIYLTPASRFVAEFIGSSNLMLGEVTAFADGVAAVVTANGLRLNVRCERPPAGATVTALIRPERVQILTAEHQRDDALVAEIRSLVYLGEDVQFQVLVDGRETMLISMKANADILPAVGERLTVGIDPGDVFVIPH